MDIQPKRQTNGRDAHTTKLLLVTFTFFPHAGGWEGGSSAVDTWH